MYYVSALGENAPFAVEYYIAEKDTKCLSDEAKKYGNALSEHPELLTYRLDEPESGAAIVKYECQKFCISHDLPLPDKDDILTTVVFGRENYPEYFGDYPVPLVTPKGNSLRYERLMRGVYIIETDRGELVIAVAYPIWSCDFSEYTLKRGEKTEYDSTHGIDNTLGYLLFSEHAGALEIYELMQNYEELTKSELIDVPALMNAFWTRYPDYATM